MQFKFAINDVAIEKHEATMHIFSKYLVIVAQYFNMDLLLRRGDG